jgi:hypothetical protein
MELGIISPINLLRKYSADKYLQYCYCTIARESPEYRGFYTAMAQEGKRVILEWAPILPRGNDRSLNCMEFRDLAECIKPSLVVLPSKDFNFMATMELISRFGSSLCWSNWPINKFLGLLQGATVEETERCYAYYKSLHLQSIGLASPLELVSSRNSLLDILQPTERVYFIEVYSNPIRELPKEDIEGFCSAFPVRMGLQNRSILDGGVTPPSLNFNTEEDTDSIVSNILDWEAASCL